MKICTCGNSLAQFLVHVMTSDIGIKHVFTTRDTSSIVLIIKCFDDMDMTDDIPYQFTLMKLRQSKVRFEFNYY